MDCTSNSDGAAVKGPRIALVPDAAAADNRFHVGHYKTLIAILSHANWRADHPTQAPGEVLAKATTMAGEIGIHIATFRRCVVKLEAWGYIRTEPVSTTAGGTPRKKIFAVDPRDQHPGKLPESAKGDPREIVAPSNSAQACAPCPPARKPVRADSAHKLAPTSAHMVRAQDNKPLQQTRDNKPRAHTQGARAREKNGREVIGLGDLLCEDPGFFMSLANGREPNMEKVANATEKFGIVFEDHRLTRKEWSRRFRKWLVDEKDPPPPRKTPGERTGGLVGAALRARERRARQAQEQPSEYQKLAKAFGYKR
jgi:hypothetical protein